MANNTFNPYRVKADIHERHYGLTPPEGLASIDKKYAPKSWNLVQNRYQMMDGRGGSIRRDQFDGGVLAGRTLITGQAVCEGARVWVETLTPPPPGLFVLGPTIRYPYLRGNFPEMPEMPEATCEDLWEIATNLEEYQIESRRNQDIFAQGFDINDCWDFKKEELLCSELWAMLPHLDDRRRAGYDNYNVLTNSDPEECWEEEEEEEDIPTLTCGDLFKQNPALRIHQAASPGAVVFYKGKQVMSPSNCWDFYIDCEKLWELMGTPESERNHRNRSNMIYAERRLILHDPMTCFDFNLTKTCSDFWALMPDKAHLEDGARRAFPVINRFGETIRDVNDCWTEPPTLPTCADVVAGYNEANTVDSPLRGEYIPLHYTYINGERYRVLGKAAGTYPDCWNYVRYVDYELDMEWEPESTARWVAAGASTSLSSTLNHDETTRTWSGTFGAGWMNARKPDFKLAFLSNIAGAGVTSELVTRHWGSPVTVTREGDLLKMTWDATATMYIPANYLDFDHPKQIQGQIIASKKPEEGNGGIKKAIHTFNINVLSNLVDVKAVLHWYQEVDDEVVYGPFTNNLTLAYSFITHSDGNYYQWNRSVLAGPKGLRVRFFEDGFTNDVRLSWLTTSSGIIHRTPLVGAAKFNADNEPEFSVAETYTRNDYSTPRQETVQWTVGPDVW